MDDPSYAIGLLLKCGPEQLAEACGEGLSHAPEFLHLAGRKFGELLFFEYRVCDRLDFLFESIGFKHKPRNKDAFTKNIAWGSETGEDLWLHDISDRYGGIHISLDRKKEVGCFQYFIAQLDGQKHEWGFCRNVEPNDHGVIVLDPITGFIDMLNTRRVAMILKWSTNMLTFEGGTKK